MGSEMCIRDSARPARARARACDGRTPARPPLPRRAQASARTQLRSHVRNDDIDLAISVMLRSFISSQKHTVAAGMERKFARYLNLRADIDELLLFVLDRCRGRWRKGGGGRGRGGVQWRRGGRAGAVAPRCALSSATPRWLWRDELGWARLGLAVFWHASTPMRLPPPHPAPLLLSCARRLFNDAVEEQRLTRRAQGLADDMSGFEIEIPCALFEDRAREHNCYELGPFYKAPSFAAHGYTRDEAANAITRVAR